MTPPYPWQNPCAACPDSFGKPQAGCECHGHERRGDCPAFAPWHDATRAYIAAMDAAPGDVVTVGLGATSPFINVPSHVGILARRCFRADLEAALADLMSECRCLFGGLCTIVAGPAVLPAVPQVEAALRSTADLGLNIACLEIDRPRDAAMVFVDACLPRGGDA